MAKQLKSFSFTRQRGGASRLDSFLDGHVWKLAEGTDYPDPRRLVTTQNMLYTRAKKMGIRLHTQRVSGGLIVQAERPRSPRSSHTSH